MIIVSNTSPINYLILIGHINLLPKMFKQIIIPQEVYNELSDTAAPLPVQTWIATPPDWLKVQSINQPSDAIVDLLDPGERAAILIAQERTQCRLTSARRHEGAAHCNWKRAVAEYIKKVHIQTDCPSISVRSPSRRVHCCRKCTITMITYRHQ